MVAMSRAAFVSFQPTELTVDPSHKFGYPLDATMNPWLSVDVVVLNSIEEPRQAPE